MPEAKEEAEFMEWSFRELNYEVELLMNPDNGTMAALFERLQKDIMERIKKDKRTLIHFYYTGHGKMKQ